MKRSKRKRSAKAQPVIETVGADVIVADMTGAAEPLLETLAEPVVELSPAAVEALVAEPMLEASPTCIEARAAEPIVESSPVSIEAHVESSGEVAGEPIVADVVAEQAADVCIEQAEVSTGAADVSIEQAAEVSSEQIVAEAVSESEEAVVEPAADAIAPEMAEHVSEAAVEVVAEAVTTEVAEPASDAAVVTEAAEPVCESSTEPTADAVVSETAEPAVVREPVVVLAANCSVKDAAALKTSLCAFSNHSDAVTLDVSAVERVDTATMQLLCAFVRDRSGRNQSVSWRGESQALQDAVRLLGIGALLGLETKGVAA
jgi:ABC-type transporter Mla MlaB component